MAGNAVTGDAGCDPYDVLVAIRAYFRDIQQVAAVFAFLPKLVAGSAPEMRDPTFYRALQGFGIHEREHQHSAGADVGHDGRDQAIAIKFGLEDAAGFDVFRCCAGCEWGLGHKAKSGLKWRRAGAACRASPPAGKVTIYGIYIGCDGLRDGIFAA